MPPCGLPFRVASHQCLHTVSRVRPLAATRYMLTLGQRHSALPLRCRVSPVSYKTRPQPTPTSKISLATLATSLFILYAISHSKAHRLESQSDNDDDGTWIKAGMRRYEPVGGPLSSRHADEMLSWDTDSLELLADGAKLRCDVVRLPSNTEMEDASFIAGGGPDKGAFKWVIAGIFDGHAGSQTSRALRGCLGDYVVRHVYSTLAEGDGSHGCAPPQAIDNAIKAAFLELDAEIMEAGISALATPGFLADALPALENAYEGSCALLSYYNSESRELKVACTGDSRAVLGRCNEQGEWQAIPLSEDQTGYNASEIARLEREHPNEPGMIKNGRLLGLAVTRAFGDSRWKWPRELQEEYRDRFFGPQLREGLLTPPYLTAEPVVTTTRIHPEKGDFLIMASDGLWDNMSSEQAVELVSRWMVMNNARCSAPGPDLVNSDSANVLDPGERMPFRRNPAGKLAYNRHGPITERNFVFKDVNAAVHLARNALGGADEDRLLGMLTSAAPHARRWRDDITVQVIFFGIDDALLLDVEYV